MRVVMGLLAAGILTLLALVVIEQPLTTSATEERTETVGVTIATGSGDASLSQQHWYTTLKGLSISNASGTDPSSEFQGNATLSPDRRTVEFTGMTTNEAVTLDITYRVPLADTTVGIVLKVVPFLVALAGIAAMLGNVAIAGLQITGRTGFNTNAFEGVMVVFIGVVLLPVVLAFVTSARESYEIAPEFIGVLSVLSLITIAYVLAILSSAVGAVAPRARGILGGMQ